MVLSKAEIGKSVCIREIQGENEMRKHLGELGLVVGEEVSIVLKCAGNFILQVKDSRLALDAGMVNRIII
jgi:ferrous iron transport protein A